MTVPIPLAAFPGAGTSRAITGRPLTPGAVLVVSRPGGPARASTPGHGSQPTPPGWPRDRSGLWLRNAAGGLCVLAAAAAAVSFTAFGGLRYQNCLNACEVGVERGRAESRLAGCGG
jgi:hypothetical protein